MTKFDFGNINTQNLDHQNSIKLDDARFSISFKADAGNEALQLMMYYETDGEISIDKHRQVSRDYELS